MENLGDHVNFLPDVTNVQFLSIESIKFSPDPVQVNIEFAAHFAQRLDHVDGSMRFREPEKIWSGIIFSEPNERWAMVQTAHLANERVPKYARVAPSHVPGNARDGAVSSESVR
jgi:hypothetical protein